jgi:hypothetical protein
MAHVFDRRARRKHRTSIAGMVENHPPSP